MIEDQFFDQGWAVFPNDPAVEHWVDEALPFARAAIAAPENGHLLACDGTWFVGLDALPNDADGRLGAGPPLAGAAAEFATAHCGGWPALHRAQLSVTYPGYPRPREGESPAAFRYRQNRDAAHVDGIIGMGSPKRRFVQEPHAFILGLPMTEASKHAAPLVVWPGSHRILQRALKAALDRGQGDLSKIDVTEVYQSARREAFERCARVTVHGPVGSAILLHRHLLHGVASWAPQATAGPDGRMIAYFRPELAGGVAAWATAP